MSFFLRKKIISSFNGLNRNEFTKSNYDVLKNKFSVFVIGTFTIFWIGYNEIIQHISNKYVQF